MQKTVKCDPPKMARLSGALQGYAQIAESAMMPECGPRVVHHWAHASRARTAIRGGKTKLTAAADGRTAIPEEPREVSHTAPDVEIHRADIKTSTGIVIERATLAGDGPGARVATNHSTRTSSGFWTGGASGTASKMGACCPIQRERVSKMLSGCSILSPHTGNPGPISSPVSSFWSVAEASIYYRGLTKASIA